MRPDSQRPVPGQIIPFEGAPFPGARIPVGAGGRAGGLAGGGSGRSLRTTWRVLTGRSSDPG